MPWDPERYNQFQAERFAPFVDALALVRVRPRLSVIDLGCGAGELTRRLADALPDSDVVGLDSSKEMLAKAAAHARAGLRFEQGTIEEASGAYDLVFSHAAIQWVDDHARLVPRLLSMVRPGGQLVVQQPSNHGHATHVLIREVAAEEPFRSALSGFSRQSPVLGLDDYASLLHAAGGTELVVFEKVYPHVLQNADALADWTSGTALVPYFERLPHAMHAAFMTRYRQELHARFPGEPVFYGFRRTLLAATVPAGG
ncbi:MAG: methyltransferase domain-containing protein [Polyangiales bacterium]